MADAFLVLKGTAAGNIQAVGESLDPAFKGGIEVVDFTVGAENVTAIGSATSGAGTGKARLKELVIRKKADKASGPLFQACCTGAHFPEATLSIRKISGSAKPVTYLIYRFSMVFCTKLEWAGPGEEGPEETVTFVYGGVQVVYQAMDSATGAPVGSAATTTWNQVLNNASYPVAGA